MTRIILFILLAAVTTTLSYADTVIDTRRLVDAGRVIDVSWDSINMLKFPDEITDIKTTKKINTSIQGNTALVSLGQPIMTEVYVMTANGKVYSLILKPKSNAMAFNYVFKDEEVEAQKILRKEAAIPFEVVVRDLILQAKQEGKISGYHARTFNNMSFDHNNLLLEKKISFTGLNLIVELWDIKNNGSDELKLKEQDFYEEGVVAIMFDEQMAIAPKGNSLMYLVRKKS